MRIRFKTVRSPRLPLNDGEPVEPPKKEEKKEKNDKKQSPWKQKHSKRRFLGIMLAMFIGLVVLMVVGVAVSVGLFLYSGSDAVIEVSNLTPNSATVVWVSEISEPGVAIAMKGAVPSFQLGMTEGVVGYDDRDYADAEEKAAAKYQKLVESGADVSDVVSEVKVKDFGWYKVHHVTFKDLDPGTQYNVMVGNGYIFKPIDNNTFTTRHQQDFFSLPSPAYGLVVKSSGGNVVKDGVMKLALVDNEGVLITDKLSAPLGENGSWYVDINSLYRVTGERYSETSTEYEFDTTMELHEVVTAEGVYQQKLFTWDDAPSPEFILQEAEFKDVDVELESNLFNKVAFRSHARPIEEDDNWRDDEASDDTPEGAGDASGSDGYHPVDYQPTDDTSNRNNLPDGYENGSNTGGGQDDSTNTGSTGATEQEEHSPDPNHPHYTVPTGNVCSDGTCGAITYQCLINDTRSDDCWRLCVNGYWAMPEGCYNWGDGGSSGSDEESTPTEDTNRDGVVDENDEVDPEAETIDPYVCCWDDVKTSFARSTEYTKTETCPADYDKLGTAKEETECFARFRLKDDDKYVDEDGNSPAPDAAKPLCCVNGNEREWDFTGECRYGSGWSIDESIGRYECEDQPEGQYPGQVGENVCCKSDDNVYKSYYGVDDDYCEKVSGLSNTNVEAGPRCEAFNVLTEGDPTPSSEYPGPEERVPCEDCHEIEPPPCENCHTEAQPVRQISTEEACEQGKMSGEFCNESGCNSCSTGFECTSRVGSYFSNDSPVHYKAWKCIRGPEQFDDPPTNDGAEFTEGDHRSNCEAVCNDTEPNGDYRGVCSTMKTELPTWRYFRDARCDNPGYICERNAGFWFLYRIDGTRCGYYNVRNMRSADIAESNTLVGRANNFFEKIISRVSAQDRDMEEYLSDSSILYLPEEQAYSFFESGTYQFIYEGDVYDVTVSDVENNYILYVDNNDNGYFEPETDERITKDPVSLALSKQNDAFRYTLKPGYNFVSFNFVPDEYEVISSNFLKDLNEEYDNAFYSIATYESGQWKIIGSRNGEVYGVDNFQIVPGRGYLLKSKTYVNLDMTGVLAKDPVPVKLNQGWNLISVHGLDDLYSAKELISSVNNEGMVADNVTQWDPSKGKYDGLQASEGEVYGFNYPLYPLNAYFVRITSGEGDWTPK